MGDTWMVCAFTHDEALRRYRAADLHGRPYPERLLEWVSWACWLAAIYVAAIGVLGTGGQANSAAVFALATLGMIAAFTRPAVFLWAGFTAELAWLASLSQSNPDHQLLLGSVVGVAILYWLVFWVERWFHLRHRISVLFQGQLVRRGMRGVGHQ